MTITSTFRPGGERIYGVSLTVDEALRRTEIHLGRRTFRIEGQRKSSETRQQRIEAYGERYAQIGKGLFSEKTTGHTPLLESFTTLLESTQGKIVIEAGAGSGRQTEYIAKGLDNVHVIAVEPNAQYSGIYNNLSEVTSDFKPNAHVSVIEDDITAYLQEQAPNSIDGIHAHSLVHFWDERTRAEFYQQAHRALVPNGMLAISLKGIEDSQLERATITRRNKQGVYAKDPDYNLIRLFVRNPQSIVNELKKAGFELINDPLEWRVAGYDFPDQPEKQAHFVGFLAKKIA